MFYLQNDKGKVNYGELTRQAERILNGTARLNTLSLAEEQGRRRGGRTAIEVSILIGASESASRKGQDSELRSEVIARQEKLLSDYADKNNLWIDESKVEKEASAQLPSNCVYVGYAT